MDRKYTMTDYKLIRLLSPEDRWYSTFYSGIAQENLGIAKEFRNMEESRTWKAQ